MRTSLKKTTAAILRSVIGIKDFEMAELLGCSTSTIHSVESGRLKLSDSLALRMGLVTGVNVDWLLAGDTSKSPTTQYQNHPYSRSEFEDWLLTKTEWLRVNKTERAMDAVKYFAQLRGILESANKRGDYIMARYKVRMAIEALRDQFGPDLSSSAHLGPGRGGWLVPKAIKVAEGAIADVRAFILACERNAKRERRAAKRRSKQLSQHRKKA